jgi:mono/diheme cytochrome c family protein
LTKLLLKWTGIAVGAVLGVVVVALCAVYLVSTVQLKKRYPLEVAPVAIPTDSAAIARGSHLAHALVMCVDCHGEDLAGTTVINQPPFAVVTAPNITPAARGKELSDLDLVRAIRYGVTPDGRSLVVMPSAQYYYLSDADLGAVIAYVRSVPPAQHDLKPTSYGPISRTLLALGKLPVLQAPMINRSAARPSPSPGVTVEYGSYLALPCRGCHGPGLSGGVDPAGDPTWPPASNLTPEGLGRWTLADFTRLLREGKRPVGTEVNPAMPWRWLKNLSDDEIAALWMYLQSVPPQPFGGW